MVDTAESNIDVAPDQRDGRARFDRPWLIPVVATAVMLLPVFVVLVRWPGRHWLPTYDSATHDLLIRDVWSTHIPLVGPPTRLGFNHPNGLFLWVIALIAGPFGFPAWASVVGAAVAEGAAVAATVWVAWWCGRTRWLLIVGAAVVLANHGLGANAFVLLWQPNIAFPFFMLLIVLVWGVAAGKPRALIGVAGVGSFVVGIHLGYAPVVGVLVASALGLVIYDCRRGREGYHLRELRSTLVFSAVVTFLVWLPPLIQVAQDPPGNLYHIVRGTLKSSEPVAGLRTGAGLIAAEFRWLPSWVGGSDLASRQTGAAIPASLAWLLLPIALVLVGWVATRRSGSQDDRRILAIMSGLFV